MSGVELRIVDLEGSEVPAGEVGEIWIRSAQNMKGYWADAEATAAVAEAVLEAMRPGARISEVQARGREVYAKARPGYHPIAQTRIDGILGL